MARRRKAITVYRRAPSFGGFRPAAPIIIRQRTGGGSHKKKHRRRRGGGGDSSSLTSKENLALVAAAFLLGYIDKQGVKVPTIPILGRAGSIAVGLFFAGRQFHSPLMIKGAKAAAVIAGYELGNKGQVSGVHGVDTV